MSDAPTLQDLLEYYRLLRIAVTDREETIRAAAAEWEPWALDLAGSPDIADRTIAKRFQDACKELTKASSRNKTIDAIFDYARDQLKPQLSAMEGKPIRSEIFGSLKSILVRQYSFEEDLADRRLRAYLGELGIDVDSDEAYTPDPPRLVDDLKIAPLPDCVQLNWKLPPEHCEGVIVVRTQTGRPKSPDEGAAPILGKPGHPVRTEQCDDKTAVPGNKYTYGVFSVFKGQASADSRWGEGYRIPGGIRGVGHEVSLSGVKLWWERPEKCRRVYVFRTAADVSEIAHDGDRLLPPPGCAFEKVVEEQDACLDPDLAPGAARHYHLLADFGGGMFSLHVSHAVAISRAETVSGLKAAGRKEGVSLHWKRPAKNCESVTVVRSPAAGEASGSKEAVVIAGGAIEEWLDKAAVPGTRYTYAVYSLCDGLRGLHPAVCNGYRLRPAPDFPPPQFTEEGLRLPWTRPSAGHKLIVVRSQKAGPMPEVCDDVLTLPEGCSQVWEGEGTSWVDHEPDLDTEYRYYLLARLDDGTYTAAAARSFRTPPPLQAPRGLAITEGAERIVLRWEAGGKGSRKYELFRLTDKDLAQLARAKPLAELTTTRFEDTTAEVGQPCYYYVRAVDVGRRSEPVLLGEAVATAEVQDYRADPLPGAVRLSWRAPHLPDLVQIERLRGGQVRQTWEVAPQEQPWLDRGLSGGEPLTYRIRLGFRGRWSPGVETDPCQPQADALNLPGGGPCAAEPAVHHLRCVARAGVLEVSWDKPADNDPRLVAVSGGEGWRLHIVPGQAGSQRFEELPTGRYQVEVRRLDAAGNLGPQAAHHVADVPAGPGGGA